MTFSSGPISLNPVAFGGLPLFPPNTTTTWNPGIIGGVPNATTISATLSSPGTGDATVLIQNAINAAHTAYVASGRTTLQVVLLNAGNYFCTSWILLNVDGVVLRGSGADTTRIVSSSSVVLGGPAPAIVLGGQATYISNSAINLTVDALKDSKTLVVADASTISVGDILQLDQIDSAVGVVTQLNGGTTTPHFLNGYLYFADGIFFKRQVSTTPSQDSNGPFTIGTPFSGGHGSFLADINFAAQNEGPFRSILQQVEVAGKSGNTLTISDVLHVDFTVARQAAVFTTVPVNTDALGNLGTRRVGLENIAVTGGTNNNIVLDNLAYSWVKNVESDGHFINGDNLHPGMTGQSVALTHCYRCVVRDSYVHHAKNIVQGGGAYGISMSGGCSECLIENNIAIFLNKPIVIGANGGGNVVGYNYADNAIIDGTSWQENAIDDCHECGSHMDLIEGNHSPNYGPDTTHGSSHWMTHFRNYASGRNSGTFGTSTLASSNSRCFGADAFSGWNNVVGNVLGSSNGLTLTYEITGTSGVNPNPADASNCWIWRLGGNGDGGTGGIWDNGYSKTQLFRHGNWDALNAAIVDFQVGYTKNFPDSVYLASRPTFFNTYPSASTWPWVFPLSGTIAALPAKFRYDNGTPNSP